MLHHRDGVPIDLTVRVVRANRDWLEECWAGWSARKQWDKLTDAEADWWRCQPAARAA